MKPKYDDNQATTNSSNPVGTQAKASKPPLNIFYQESLPAGFYQRIYSEGLLSFTTPLETQMPIA